MDSVYSLCDSCNKQVLTANLIMHQLYCERSNQVCVTCGQNYDVNDEEEHILSVHKPNTCQYCFKYFSNLKNHQCTLQPQNCLYCIKQFSFDQIEKHIEQCGSTLFVCKYCKTNLPQKLREDHVPKCQLKYIGHIEYFCRFCEFKFLTQSQLIEHELVCVLKPFECPYCRFYIPDNQKEEHLYYCGARTDNCCFCKQIVTLSNQVNHQLECCRKRLEQRLQLKKKQSSHNQISQNDEEAIEDYMQQLDDYDANNFDEQ